MSITVTMLQTRLGEGGELWTAGNSYAASDDFGTQLITANLATGAIPQPAATALTAAQTQQMIALASVDGIYGIGGRGQVFDGGPIPDPRKRAGMSGLFATQSSSSGYLDPTYGRRIVVTLDISATTSGVTAAGGQDLTLFPTAAAAGFRWDEPNRPFRSATSQANNSLAVISIKEA